MEAEHPSSKMSPFQALPPITSLRDLSKVMDENPLARDAMEQIAAIVMAENVYIHYTPDNTPDNKPGASVVVQRQSLLDACSSLDSLHGFLKQQLGIAASQDIDVRWSDDAQPGGKQVKLTAKPNNPFQLAFIVGRAAGWFVSVKQ